MISGIRLGDYVGVNVTRAKSFRRNAALVIIAVLSVSACTSQPIVGPPVYIHTKTYIPIPATLTQPISVDLAGQTWGGALGTLKAGLDSCNADKAAIATLKPPPSKLP